MSPPVTVRSARPDDAGRLAELLEAGSLTPGTEDPGAPELYRRALAEIQDGRGGDVLVAVDDRDRPVGVCQLLVFRHLQRRGGRCAEVESLHVDPAWRSRGVGAVLLAAAVERARAAGCYRVQLTSNLQRRDAHRFYLREGFEPSHVGFKLYLDGPS